MGLGVRQRAATGDLDEVAPAFRGAPTLAPGAFETVNAARQGRCPELDCVRAWLSTETAAAAESRARKVGTGADRVLISAGLLDDEIYVRALADALGVAFEPLDDTPRESCPIDDDRLIEACAAGILPLMTDDRLRLVVAPRGGAARRITGLIASNPKLAPRFALSTAERLQQFVMRDGAAAIGERAAHALSRARPDLSAGPSRRLLSAMAALTSATIAAAILIAALGPATFASSLALTMLFLAWMIFRLAGVFIGGPPRPRAAQLRDDELPVYTVMIALYREVAAVKGLVAALRQIDYPGIMAQTPQT
jgi:hypothetical protein